MTYGLLFDDSGQDLIEYALLAALISVAAVATVAALGVSIQGLFWDELTATVAGP